MSAGRADRNHPTHPTRADQTNDSALSLPASAVTIRKNGIEFLSTQPLAQWTEVTLSIESSVERKRVNCRGVVVACEGNRHKGYQVSLLFLGVTPQIRERLDSIALSHLS